MTNKFVGTFVLVVLCLSVCLCVYVVLTLSQYQINKNVQYYINSNSIIGSMMPVPGTLLAETGADLIERSCILITA